MQLTDFRLYLITDRQQTGGRSLLEVLHRSLEGGVKAVQLREKDLSTAELHSLAAEVRLLTSQFDARLIINDRVDIALAVGADGVHVGVNSMPVAVVRRLLGKDKIIGCSAHAIDEALAAQSAGADFVTFGPVYFTPSKAEYGTPCGVKKMAEAVSVLAIPVVALGGISEARIPELLTANVRGVAVISAVMAATDPRAVAASLLKMIEENV
ncbi:MAG TPA: thiamine phosphate synthase [Desulfuromonadales bacterium]|nr:thiamine phosphate synthase [Desulfuromonadales bacterium]